MIGHYETQVKRPSIDKVKKLADALNISADSLMDFPESSKKHSKNDLSYKIMKKVRLVENLPARDRNAVFQLINSLVEKNKLRQESQKNKK